MGSPKSPSKCEGNFYYKIVWKVIGLVNVVDPIWQLYKSSIKRQVDKVMIHLIFQSDVEVCHENMMNFKNHDNVLIMQIYEVHMND